MKKLIPKKKSKFSMQVGTRRQQRIGQGRPEGRFGPDIILVGNMAKTSAKVKTLIIKFIN